MANTIQVAPGREQFVLSQTSSFYDKAIGKFTDSNSLFSLYESNPAKYDKQIVSLFSQLKLYSNDFLNLIDGASPFFIEGNSDAFTYEIQREIRYPKILINLSEGLTKPGIDGTEFSLVLDRNAFQAKHRVSAHFREQEKQLFVVRDPQRYGKGWKYDFKIISSQPGIDFASEDFLQPGTELRRIDSILSEFDVDMPGLGLTDGKIEVMETLGEAFGVKHKVTKWAESRQFNVPKNREGQPLDITVIGKSTTRGDGQKMMTGGRWINTLDMLLQREMLEQKVNKLIWGRGGSITDEGGHNEIYVGKGLWEQLHQGNIVYYNRGEFGLNLLRNVFGDLFYRRVRLGERRVLIWTNEAGFQLVNDSLLKDIKSYGFDIRANDGFITNINKNGNGKNMNMGIAFAFDHFVTMETGMVEFKHLDTLDFPVTNMEFGQHKKSAPIFIVMDVSNAASGTGTPQNVRIVRHKGWPNMTWGYVPGRIDPRSGIPGSVGMTSSNSNPWYEIWYEDRCGIFLEDPSRTVIIKERPLY